MALELWFMNQVGFMKVAGRMIKDIILVLNYLLVEIHIKESILTEKLMVKVFIIGSMENPIKDNFLKG